MTTTAAAPTTALDKLYAHLRETALLGSVGHVVSWDQETYMPDGAAPLRSEQLQMLSGMVHDRASSSELGELIARAAEESVVNNDELAQANVREAKRDYDKATKLPKELVEEMAKCASLGMTGWREAREKQDFSLFLPWLEKTVELNRRKAECLGIPAGGEAYDALMDTFEPGMTAQRTAEIFAPLREFTVDLLARVQQSGVEPDMKPGTTELPIDKQREFCAAVIEQMGYDFTAGRMDDTTHPFCSGFGPGDTRITNRYRPDAWLDALSSATHEAGHGMYEQGLPKSDRFGQPAAEAVSLGMHESQSRMWENQVGRSRDFWKWGVGAAQRAFGDALGGADAEAIFRAANAIAPNFIRVESDELTYNLHIMLRFDLERAMIAGELACNDLPGIWNERMKSDFGLEVPNDAMGCLQDVHWSMGAMGYFPTYTFGNLYAAQLWEAMGAAQPDRDERIARGDFAGVLEWLRTNIHAHGRRYPAEELCERVTGSRLDPAPLMRHLEEKAKAVYGV